MAEYRSVPLPIGEGDSRAVIASVLTARGKYLKGQGSYCRFSRDSRCCWIETGYLMECSSYKLADELGFASNEVPYVNTYVNSVFNLCGGDYEAACYIILEAPELIDKIIDFVNGDDTYKHEFFHYPRGNDNGT